MIYIYAFKRNGRSTWNIAQTTTDMNERDFLHYIFNSDDIYGRLDCVRILEIIDERS